MLQSSLGFFVLAVVLGVYLLSFILRNKQIPIKVAMAHGLVGAIGIILLIIYPFYYSPAPMTSLILFVAAALGGLTMMYMGISGKKVPAWMAIGHGMVGVIGLITLIAFFVV